MSTEMMGGLEAYDDLMGSEDEDFEGEASQDVVNYGTPAAGALLEAISRAVKSKEDDAAAKKLKAANAEGDAARKAASDADKKAAMLEAEALSDPSKQAAATQARKEAQTAAAKAAYYGATGSSSSSSGPVTALAPMGHGAPSSSIFTVKNAAIAGGVVLVGAVLVKLLRRK